MSDAPEVWSGEVPPGGFVCSVCGTPVESEPCREHMPLAYARMEGTDIAMSKRLVLIQEQPNIWIDPEKIAMVKAVSNTAKEELTRIWVEGMGSTGITVPGTPKAVLHRMAAGNPDGFSSLYVA